MAGLKLPEGPVEILGDKISRAGVSAADGKRLEAMGLAAMEYANEQAAAAYLNGLRDAITSTDDPCLNGSSKSRFDQGFVTGARAAQGRIYEKIREANGGITQFPKTGETEGYSLILALTALVELVDHVVLVQGEAAVASWPHRKLTREETEIIQASRTACRGVAGASVG